MTQADYDTDETGRRQRYDGIVVTLFLPLTFINRTLVARPQPQARDSMLFPTPFPEGIKRRISQVHSAAASTRAGGGSSLHSPAH